MTIIGHLTDNPVRTGAIAEPMTMEPETHVPLAPRDLLILAVLAEGPLHGYGIIKAVEARSRSGVLLDSANLYRVLRRMKRLGWIGEALGTGEETDRGNVSAETPQLAPKSDTRRKTYLITQRGKSLLSAELARLERLLEHAHPALADGEGA